MAVLNYSLPFGAPPATSWATISPIHASPHAVNNLYEPAGHHQENVLHNDDYYKNGPYRHQQSQQQQASARNYLPPQQQLQNSNNRNGYAQAARTRTYGENGYSHQSPSSFSNHQQTNNGYYNNGQSFKENPYQTQQQQQAQKQPQPQTTKAPNSRTTASFQSSSNSNSNNYNLNQAAGYPERPPGFKPIQAGQGSRTQNGKSTATPSTRLRIIHTSSSTSSSPSILLLLLCPLKLC
jgi:hypothetical protein